MKNWCWFGPMPDNTEEDWKRIFEGMRASGVHAILPEVFNGHVAWWASDHLPVTEVLLERLIPLAHAADLEIHAWMHTMTCNIPEIHESHPEWYGVNGRGESTAVKPPYVGYYRFLCPSRPEVHQFLRRRVGELAAMDGLAGIHLDYIRFPDVILAEALQPKYGIVQDREYPEYDYCYCEVCREGFRHETGIDVSGLDDPAQNDEWRQFRCDRITDLVNDVLVPVGRAAGKQMTAAVFPNWRHVRQQWHRWQVDGVLPMLYQSFYGEDIAWIGSHCQAGLSRMQETGVTKPLYSGLFVPALDPGDLRQAIEVSGASGASGVSLFALGSMSDAHWEAFSAATT
ncbi:MAG TPA: family 10 glycosylhydrolase [Candidatus Latescibacteria bacterium]|jgi:uncharacterized lipoprotein YddW (UPF0748 family)|nr:family 10 glycosylhydrolase [Candidatus Latescibacterota bacterium]